MFWAKSFLFWLCLVLVTTAGIKPCRSTGMVLNVKFTANCSPSVQNYLRPAGRKLNPIIAKIIQFVFTC